MKTANAPYPIDSLPPLFAGVVKELVSNLNVPPELAAPLVLGVASLACQGAVDVRRPDCEPSPTQLYTLVVAGSGMRKTSVLRKLLLPVIDLQHELADEAKSRQPQYDAAILSWELKKTHLLAEIKKQIKRGESVEQLQDCLTSHVESRPVAHVVPKFIYEDPTPEAVVDGLCNIWHSASVISSEGGGVLNGRSLGDLAMWNRLWDGMGIGAERIGRGSISEPNARGGLIIAAQDGQFQKFLEARGEQATDIGFFGRTLFSVPPSNIGSRIIYSREQSPDWSCLEKFQERVASLLRAQVTKGVENIPSRIVLKFDTEVKNSWIECSNIIERYMLPGGEYSSVPSYGSKIMENVARVAAIFHYFQQKDGSIKLQEFDGARRICGWHATEFMNVFKPKPEISVEYKDAQILEGWLAGFVWNIGRMEIKKNDIRQRGPNQIRNKYRLDNALMVLARLGRVVIWKMQNKTIVVRLNLEYFSSGMKLRVNGLV